MTYISTIINASKQLSILSVIIVLLDCISLTNTGLTVLLELIVMLEYINPLIAEGAIGQAEAKPTGLVPLALYAL